MSKFIWVLEHMILPFVIPLILLLVGYYSDWGGIRSAKVNDSINDVERAIESAYERCAPLSSTVHDELVKAQDYKWLAIKARDADQFSEAQTQIKNAIECIENARNLGCPEMYVPREEQWREKTY